MHIKGKIILVLISVVLGSFCVAAFGQTTIIVRPNKIDDCFTNHGIGFTTFQRFNGDKWEGYQDCLGHATLTDHEGFSGPLEWLTAMNTREDSRRPESKLLQKRSAGTGECR